MERKRLRSSCPRWQFAIPKELDASPLVRLLGGSARICFNHDIHLGPAFKTGLASIAVAQNILNANLPVEMVRLVDTNLRLLSFAGKRRLDYFFHGPT